MSRAAAFFGGLGAAAALAAAVWFLRVQPELRSARVRTEESDDALRALRREAADRAQEAAMERSRNVELEERVKELERQLTTAVPTPRPPMDGTGTGNTAGHTGGHGVPMQQDPPEDWKLERISQEFENVAAAGPAVPQHPRLPLLVRAFRAQKANGVNTLRQVVASPDWDAAMVVTAALVGGELGERDLVEPFFARWRTEKNADVRYALLRALAALPGDEIVPGLVDVWNDPNAARHARGVAIEGLGRRGIETAIDVATGASSGGAVVAVDPAHRARALVGLRDFAEKGGWKDDVLASVFGKALRGADGDTQRRIAIASLEGFWSEIAARELAAFAADGAAPPTLAVRAKRSAEAITKGEKRPEGAGSLESGLRKSE